MSLTRIPSANNAAAGQGVQTVLQAHLGNNMTSTTFVAGNANVVYDTIGTGNWKFYVAGGNSVAAITSSSNSSEWTGGNLLGGIETFDGTLVNATFAADANSRFSGKSYLQIANPTGVSSATFQYARFTPFAIPANGFSFAFWFWTDSNPAHIDDEVIDIRGTTGNIIGIIIRGRSGLPTRLSFQLGGGLDFTSYSVPNSEWIHIVTTVAPSGNVKLYINGIFIQTVTFSSSNYPTTGLIYDTYNIGTFSNVLASGYSLKGTNRFDNFKVFAKVLLDAEVLTEKLRTSDISKITPSSALTTPAWNIKPETVVDPSETSYTVKSNEIALTPGANSTYAVWTAPKSTNIRVDVSFADYHSRNVGVGFQMFKINNDDTFGSVLFNRTVTSLALTNAAPANYLTVPSKRISVATGDKIYIRIDANGNTTSASSVLAASIYTDTNRATVLRNSNPNETTIMQAHLGNNMTSTTFVAGNANTVYDTVGTGSWKFYVAGGNSIASITSSSNSSEWTGGNLLSYDSGSPIILNYSFDTTTQSGSTIKNLATNDYGLTLNGATIATASPAPHSTENSGYLTMNVSSGQYATSSVPLSFSPPWSISFWHKFTGTQDGDPTLFEIGNTTGSGLRITSTSSYKVINAYINGANTGANYYANIGDSNWNYYVISYGDNGFKSFLNGYLVFADPSNLNTTSNFTYMNFGKSNIVTNPTAGNWTINIDKFQIFNTGYSGINIAALYNGTYVAPTNGKITDSVTGATWKPIPATVVDATETSYTVKSNEIALTPGTNSTYAVWTAPKSTNIRVDVSFADYHSRNVGVGFQMFKINNDDTFGSTLFNRTVTSAALTNANPLNYLSVPSKRISVATGDKIYIRIDANGNTTSASSVLATTIYTDANRATVLRNSNPNETKLLQASLGNNMTSTEFVTGNANVVYDTIGTGNWKFYVASGNSIASITSSSNSSEWTGGSLLGGNETFDGTLIRGATFAVGATPRLPNKPYLQFFNIANVPVNTANYAKFPPFEITQDGISSCFWFRTDTNTTTNPVRGDDCLVDIRASSGTIGAFNLGINKLAGNIFLNNSNYNYTIPINTWIHIVAMHDPTSSKLYIDGNLKSTIIPNTFYPPNGLKQYYNIGTYANSTQGGYSMTGNTQIDNFKMYPRMISQAEVTAEYNRTSNISKITPSYALTTPAWNIKPATVVDPFETSYTVKSNEIALTPGANSTYAIWTAPKTTNIRVDVSFADYHSRNVGVGFQMFKINNDDTFGSTLFNRTVTSLALTNAAPANYLTVPSKNLSVAAGDKVVYRIDANGNTTSASSVIATNIYSYYGSW